MTGWEWDEATKVTVLGHHLKDRALLFFEQNLNHWWQMAENCDFVMSMMGQAYVTNLPRQEVARIFGARKESNRSWQDHVMYLAALVDVSGFSPDYVLENVVKYANPDLRIELMSKCDLSRPDPIQHANELAVYAHELEAEYHKKSKPKVNTVNSLSEPEHETRTCHSCGAVGHLARHCPNRDSSGRSASPSPRKAASSSP